MLRSQDHPNENLILLDLANIDDSLRLKYLLAGMHLTDDLAAIADPQISQRRTQIESRLRLPGARLAELLMSTGPTSIGARSVVIEDDYIDRDSNIAYTELHARAFRDYPRRTLRLHFFDRVVSYDDLMDEDALNQSYLGYSVLSPTQPGIVGRTVLKPPAFGQASLIVPCQSRFSANLSGAQLEARGSAFIQQDGRIAACASAATWMSSTIAAKRTGFDVTNRSIAEITQLATRHSLPPDGRGAPPGLQLPQILWALHEMGYEPIIHSTRDATESKEAIYRYASSGIPPILVIGLPSAGGMHAITVVGFAYEAIVPAGRAVFSESDWYPYFLVNDDQMGMYIKLWVAPANAQSGGRPALEVLADDFANPQIKTQVELWYQNAVLISIIGLLPPRQVLPPEQAAAKARIVLSQAFALHQATCGPIPTPAILRTYFVASNEYRRRRRSASVGSQRSGVAEALEVVPWYRGTTYPRFVWVTELCTAPSGIAASPLDLEVVADVTIDPTSSERTLDFISIHLPKMFFRMSPTARLDDALRSPAAVFPVDAPFSPTFDHR